MRKTLGALALLTLAGLSASTPVRANPGDCAYTYYNELNQLWVAYRWVGTLAGTCDDEGQVAIEVRDYRKQIQSIEELEEGPEVDDLYFHDVIFDPVSGPTPSVWDVDVYLKAGANHPVQVLARRNDVSIRTIRIHPHTNADRATLVFEDAGSDNAPFGGAHYTFTLVRSIEREIDEDDVNNDLSTLAVYGHMQTLG